MTAKLRDYLYQDNSAPKNTLPPSFAAPSHAGSIAGKESNSPAKASPHESYQGSDPQTEIQNMHAVIGTRHSKVAGHLDLYGLVCTFSLSYSFKTLTISDDLSDIFKHLKMASACVFVARISSDVEAI